MSQLFQIRQLLSTATIDADKAKAAVRNAESALALIDVSHLLGEASEADVQQAALTLQQARQEADKHIRRRAALVQAETAALDDDRKAASSAQKHAREVAMATLQPELQRLGDDLLEAAINYAAHFCLVNGTFAHQVDLQRLISKLSIEQPIRERIVQKMGELLPKEVANDQLSA